MLCINHTITNPYFNIASEEYLLKNFNDDIFLLYINEPSVIVGKHQNTMAEIDINLAQQLGVKIVRRLSGGGAVYHDKGNLNFTFIRNGSEGKLVDFKGFTKPIIDALGTLGVEAKFEGHNSLMVNGLKISGNAEHIFKNRVMHHGTLLFSSDLKVLANLLYIKQDKYADKAVKSVRASTTNISEHLASSITVSSFKEYLFKYILESFASAVKYNFSNFDIAAIEALATQKYETWEWTFGYSPSYSFERIVKQPNGTVIIKVEVVKGFISAISFKGSGIQEQVALQMETALMGCEHTIEKVTLRLENAGVDQIFIGEFCNAFF
jgi:lipoate-protein ligase A